MRFETLRISAIMPDRVAGVSALAGMVPEARWVRQDKK